VVVELVDQTLVVEVVLVVIELLLVFPCLMQL
jgi:hypothetical protein